MLTTAYLIIVDGEIDPACAEAFAPAAVTVGAGQTAIQTSRIDQAALHGVLDRLSGLGLTLLSVTSTNAQQVVGDA